MLAKYEIPGVSIEKNPDNVLTASKALTPESIEKIKAAAIESQAVFKVREMAAFDSQNILFSIELMKKGNIDQSSESA